MDQNDLYRELRGKVALWATEKGGYFKYAEYLCLPPDFLYLLGRLMLDKRVPVKAKAKVGLVLVYFISPFDIIPEFLLGPIGFGDDIILAVWTVNSFLQSVDRQVLVDNWPSHSDFLAQAEKIMAVADKYLGKSMVTKVKNYIVSWWK